jgi:polyisoprenyl-teichoic acid--peptidoglycan teichoic acid transferase
VPRGIRFFERRPDKYPVQQNLALSPTLTQRSSILGRLFWGSTFIVVTLVSAGFGATLTMTTPFQAGESHSSEPASLVELLQRGLQYGIGRPVNILVMGIDRVPPDSPEAARGPFAGRSDTMLLVRLNPTQDNVNVLTIPRDTLVEIPKHGEGKINSANALGGPLLAAEVVSKTLDYTPVDRYVRISTQAFRELVDLVGGVEVYVPKRMEYVDNTQKLKIDLQPGLQVLNGVQAEGFARYRHDELGDIGRAQRQQILLKALQKRLTNPMMLARLPQLYSVLQKYIDSDLSLGEMLALLQFGVQLQPHELKMVLLPGRFSAEGEYNASYWLMDEAGAKKVVHTYFQDGYHSTTAGSTPEEQNPKALRIAIQNASSNPNGGRLMADFLAKSGFNNTFIDEDRTKLESQTEIIVQRGDERSARLLQSTLNIASLESNSTGNIDSDLTVVVGNDWVAQHP